MINELYFENTGINGLLEEYEVLGGKINKFIQYVEENWKTSRT
jgi:hypothetical protein